MERLSESPTTTATGGEVLLEVTDLVTHFRAKRRSPFIHALCGVSLELRAGETFSVVGESGSGKTTLLRTILGLERATSGRVRFRGEDVTGLKGGAGKRFRTAASVVFQDPYTSLDPRMTVGNILREPRAIQRAQRKPGQIAELLEQVRLPPDSADRFPHEFSGGQRQRIAIARALAVDPELIILDEPVSALDVSVQAEILALLKELQRTRGVAYLFVSHDMGVVAEISDRIGVMHGGQMIESGKAMDVIRSPEHPYTRALLAAVPVPDPAAQKQRMLRPLPTWPTLDSPARPCPAEA
ncbi:ATP-binding cassette domain-containing protein [Leucobacter albus]|uniref:ATP-binding cassette domain-containing protein n=1 Tax=Leucobacter albus TaxID=272210 RepID=A0ABW3TMQ7_9MICO